MLEKSLLKQINLDFGFWLAPEEGQQKSDGSTRLLCARTRTVIEIFRFRKTERNEVILYKTLLTEVKIEYRYFDFGDMAKKLTYPMDMLTQNKKVKSQDCGKLYLLLLNSIS